MTISSQTRKAGPFNGNDVTTSFPFTFKSFAKNDVQVIHTNASAIEAILVLDSDYSVALNADQNASPGGSISYSALATGEKLTILGNVDYNQETDIQNQGGFYPEVFEDALDKLTMQVQQVNEKADRAVKVNVSSGVSPDDYLTTVNGYKAAATLSAAAAATSATNAGTSETNAATSEANASASATSAASSATSSAASASSASTSAANAAASETAAANSATSAASSANTSTTQAGIATTKAGEAAASKTAAETAATTATTKATEASASATNALNSANSASSSESTAAGYAASINPASFATAAQGVKADTALQPAAIGVSVQAYDLNTVKKNVENTFTDAQRGSVTSDNDLSFDMAVGNNFSCTPTGAGTLTFTNITSGQSGYVFLNNSGGYAISKASSVKAGASFLTTISAAGAYMISYFSPDGTNVYVTSSGVLS